MNLTLKFGVCVFLVLCSLWMNAQVTFVPNHKQWNEQVLFQSDIRSGRAFFGERSVTFAYYNTHEVDSIHEESARAGRETEAEKNVSQKKVSCFAFNVEFLNATPSKVDGSDPRKHKVNYFIGNDPSRWASGLPVYSALNYSELYPGIDLVYYGNRNELKYDFIVEPGADPAMITMQYSGLKSIQLRDNTLQLDIGFMTITELLPVAYQVIDGVKREVKCLFALDANNVHFIFPEGYDASLQLVIDPVVVASTYSGGTCMSFGFTATYDEAGNIYAGGICFGPGFPVTAGAYDATYAALHDIGISKFDPAGSNLLYCTYLGGAAEEYPLSMYVHADQLYVYGFAASADFPVTANAFDQTHGGMDDIIIFSLSDNGSTLIASTFVGSSGDDGNNYININSGDGYRGEIVVDAAGNVYVASGSTSSGFPVTAGAYCTVINGGLDAVIFKMDAALTTILWGTFLGGSIHDMAMGIRVDPAGFVYVCGGARGTFGDFPSVPGCYQSAYLGGACDGYVAKFDPSGSNLVACTFYGGPNQDMAYFIDLDDDGDVYICGEARQGAPVTPGTYSVLGSTNFIAKFNSNLTTLLFGTVVGDGTNALVIPSAFMVDRCKRIFLGGFGGSPQWPVTNDALYTTWSAHSQWYLACYSENASAQLFGSFYGSWHVDGGTSRFDPDGIVYQAVCADSIEFPIVPWAYADGTNSTLWDICVFKIDFQIERDTVHMPNVFTPNADGINDVYDVGLGAVYFFDMHIYDRWGVEVFYTNDVNIRWDGTYRKQECAEGVYYVITKHGYCTEDPYVNTGFVHLIR